MMSVKEWSTISADLNPINLIWKKPVELLFTFIYKPLRKCPMTDHYTNKAVFITVFFHPFDTKNDLLHALGTEDFISLHLK